MTLQRRYYSSLVPGMLGAFIGGATPAQADPQATIVVKAHELHVGNGEVIGGGMLLIENGRIAKVGADLTPPAGATVIEVPQGTITPGLIDANASVDGSDAMMVGDAARASDPSEALRRFFDPRHDHRHVHRGLDCCGSRCPLSYQHVAGTKCPMCGFPDASPGPMALGVRPFVSLTEESSEVVPNTRVIDSVNLRSRDFDRLLGEGVTTVFVGPDSASVIGSRGAIVRTGGAMVDRVVREADAVKASLGTDPSWRGTRNALPFGPFVTFHSRRPTTRMGVTWVFRKAFYDTKAYEKGRPTHGADTPSEEAMKVLADVLAGKVPLRIQARMQHDILTALRLTEEFGLSFTLEEGTEAQLCTDELKSRGVPVIYGPIYVEAQGYRARSAETDRARLNTMKALIDAGIPTALSAQELRDENGLSRQAMYAIRYGVSPADVTRSVTATPAKLLGLGEQIGTLEPGKRADVVLWNGEPFGGDSKPIVVLIGGKIVLDRRRS